MNHVKDEQKEEGLVLNCVEHIVVLRWHTVTQHIPDSSMLVSRALEKSQLSIRLISSMID